MDLIFTVVDNGLDYYIELFLQAKASKSAKTLKNYSNTLAQFRAFTGPHTWPVTSQHLNAFFAHCKSKKRNLKVSTIHSYYAILKLWCGWLYRLGYLDINPIDYAEKQPQPMPLPRAPQREILDKFFDRLKKATRGGHWLNLRALALWRLAEDTGLRIGEITALSINDVTLEKGRRFAFIAGQKTHRDRIVYFRKKTARALNRWREIRATLPLPPGLDALFISYHEGRWGALTSQGARQELTRRCREFGLPHITPHQFRHSHGVYWILEGGSLKDLQHQLGHTNLTTTERYAQVEDTGRAKRYKKHYKKRKS